MKILVFNRNHPNLHPRLKALKDRGHQLKYLTLRKGGKGDYLKGQWAQSRNQPPQAKLSHTLMKLKNIPLKIPAHRLFSFAKGNYINDIFNNFEPDLVTTRGFNFFTLQANWNARKHKIPVMNFHQHWLGSYTKKFMIKIFYHTINIFGPAKFINVTPIKSPYTQTYIPNTKFLPFTLDSDFVVKKNELKFFRDNKVNILAYANFKQPRKRTLLLINAIIPLIKKYPIKLHLLGNPRQNKHSRMKQFESLVQKYNLYEKITILDNRSYSEMQRLYRNFDLFVLPARDEPAAITPLEAMAQGLPAICSDTNGTAGYIEEGKSGYIFKTDDEEDLRRKTEKIIADREKLKQMGYNAYERAKDFYPDQFYKKFKKIVEEDLNINIDTA